LELDAAANERTNERREVSCVSSNNARECERISRRVHFTTYIGDVMRAFRERSRGGVSLRASPSGGWNDGRAADAVARVDHRPFSPFRAVNKTLYRRMMCTNSRHRSKCDVLTSRRRRCRARPRREVHMV